MQFKVDKQGLFRLYALKNISEYGFMPLVQALLVCRKMLIISLILLIPFFKNNAKPIAQINLDANRKSIAEKYSVHYSAFP